jgi:Lrp/AsnC family transcriptional regulator, leucine-responsive regulatory protein
VNSPSEARNSSTETFGLLDAIDLRIIEELQADARMRIAELARRVGLSAPAVAERMRRLEDGDVLSFQAAVNPRAVGYAIAAIVRISPLGGHVHAIPEVARQTPEITECYRITGEDCYFIKVYLHSIDDLEPVLDLFTPHGRTTTSIVHSAPVPTRPLPIP